MAEIITSQQIKGIKTLVRKLNVQEPDAMVLGFTMCRTGKVSEMTLHEGRQMMKELKGLEQQAGLATKKEDSAERMRKKLCALAYQYHALPRNATKAQKDAAIDWLKGWSEKYSQCGKSFNRCAPEDLPMMVTQLEKVVGALYKNV